MIVVFKSSYILESINIIQLRPTTMSLLLSSYHRFLNWLPNFNGIPALLLRLYLAPVFIMAGFSKTQLLNEEVTGFASFMADPSIIAWFGNTEWGLGLPLPALLANLVILVEFFGGWLLLVGALTRLISIPVMFTMIMAASTVHAPNGWFAITPTNPDISVAKMMTWLGVEQAEASLENSVETGKRIEAMRNILENNGNTDWLYENGNIVVLNNGIEFSATYFIMLLALFFIGAGRYTSVDYYMSKVFLPDNQGALK